MNRFIVVIINLVALVCIIVIVVTIFCHLPYPPVSHTSYLVSID